MLKYYINVCLQHIYADEGGYLSNFIQYEFK